MIEFLTPKQVEVYNLLITDMSFDDIKKELGLKTGGFNFHANNLYAIFDCNGRNSLIADYVETNFDYVELPFVRGLDELKKAVYSLTIKGYTVDEIAEILKVSHSQSALKRRQVLSASNCRNVMSLIFKSYGVQYEKQQISI